MADAASPELVEEERPERGRHSPVIASWPWQQRADDRHQRRHLNADKPHELPRDLRVEAVDPAIDGLESTIDDVEPAINCVESGVDGSPEALESLVLALESSVESLFEVANRIADLGQDLTLLAHPPLQVRYAFLERRHRHTSLSIAPLDGVLNCDGLHTASLSDSS